MNLILSHICFANAIIGLILLVEVLVKFKRPLLLKTVMLAIAVCIVLSNASQLYSYYFVYNRTLTEISRVFLFLATLNLLYIIYYHKIKRNVLIFSILLIISKLISITYFSFILKIDNSVLLNEVLSKNGWILVPRIIFGTTYIFFCLMIYRKITKSFSDNNIYFQKIKHWSKFIIFSFYLSFFCFVLQYVFPDSILMYQTVFIVASFSFSLLLLFRPAFLNNSNLEISFSDKFNKVSNTEAVLENSSLTIDTFTVEFFHKAYYTNKGCSIEELSSMLGHTPEQLKAFILVNYNSSFTDLVNKTRVQMFVDLIQSSKYSHLTIEGLSVMAGFGTRQNFHKAFKKFHGGNPSDLIRMYEK